MVALYTRRNFVFDKHCHTVYEFTVNNFILLSKKFSLSSLKVELTVAVKTSLLQYKLALRRSTQKPCSYHTNHTYWTQLTKLLWRRIVSRVYETVERPFVRLSVPLIDVAGGFAAERPAGRRYRSTCACCRRAQQQRRRSTALSSKYGQCRVDSRGTRLNTDFFKRQTYIV